MPNVKIYVDETRFPSLRAKLTVLLPNLRSLLCEALGVDVQACQFAVINVVGLPDQPQINAELFFMSKPERTADAIQALALRLRDVIADATGERAAIRIGMLEPISYIALK